MRRLFFLVVALLRHLSIPAHSQYLEDKSKPNSGYISGTWKANFVIDDRKRFRYDADPFYSDDFCNNQFSGTWTSYTKPLTKVCNWGDYRIPNSGPLDIGAGEFSVADAYLLNGWENRRLLISQDSLVREKAKQKELQEWWK